MIKGLSPNFTSNINIFEAVGRFLMISVGIEFINSVKVARVVDLKLVFTD